MEPEKLTEKAEADRKARIALASKLGFDRDRLPAGWSLNFQTGARPFPIAPEKREKVLAANDWMMRQTVAFGAALKDRIGDAPREQLSWFLEEFIYAPDVKGVADEQQRKLLGSLYRLVDTVTRGRWTLESPEVEKIGEYTSRDTDRTKWQRLPAAVRTILESYRGDRDNWVVFQFTRPTQKLIRELADAQELGRRAVYDLFDDELGPGFEWTPEAHLSAAVFKYDSPAESKLFQAWRAKLPDAVIAVLLTLIDQTPIDRLRKCEYPTDAKACGHVFVATKGQKWCPRHRGEAQKDRNRRAQTAHRTRASARTGERRGRGRPAKVERKMIL